MMLANHLALDEIACPCCGRGALNIDMLMAWERLRAWHGRPIHVTSGYRCPRHNTRVHGAHDSQHLIGTALDVRLDSDDPDMLITLFRSGFRGVGRYDGWTHEAHRIYQQWKRGG